tara:strand:- start:465 stop:677 length:213 start_codon:yes stop_codon:yes gene_type:complete
VLFFFFFFFFFFSFCDESSFRDLVQSVPQKLMQEGVFLLFGALFAFFARLFQENLIDLFPFSVQILSLVE